MGILDVIRQSQGRRKGIPGRDTRPVAPQANRPTLIQGGPAYFTPEGYQAPIQPEQAFMPTDKMGDPIGDMFRGRTPPDAGFIPPPPRFRDPTRPPRDEFISIGGPGGNDGMGDPRMAPGGNPNFNERGPSFEPPVQQPDFNLGDYKDDIMEMVRNNFKTPSFDDSSLREMIQQNQQQIGNMPQFDPSQLQSQIGGLQDQFSNMPQFDPSQLQDQIGGLQNQIGNIPAFDPSQLQDQIGGLQDQFGQFDPSQFQFDPSQLQDQIGGLEKRFGNIPSFDPSQLQDQITSIAQRPSFDPSQLQDQITSIGQRPSFDDSELRDMISKNRTGITSIPAFDPSTLELPDFNKFATRDDLENRPIYDDTALRDQITSIGQRPGFDDAALRQMIEQNRGDIRDIPMPPSFERIDEREDPIISRMPNENPVPFLPKLSPSPMPMPAPIATPRPMSGSFGMRNIRGMR